MLPSALAALVTLLRVKDEVVLGDPLRSPLLVNEMSVCLVVFGFRVEHLLEMGTIPVFVPGLLHTATDARHYSLL